MKIEKNLRLLQLFFAINFRAYLVYYLFIGAGLIVLVGSLSYLITLSQPNIIPDYLNASFWTFANTAGMVITTSAYSIYNKKNNKIHLLMLPVSSQMRFSTMLILSIPIFMICNVIFLTIITNGVEYLFSMAHIIKPTTFNPLNMPYPNNNSTFLEHSFYYILFQSLFLMLGSFFPRYGFLKSTATIIFLMIIYFISNAIFQSSHIDDNFYYGFYAVLTSNTYQHETLRSAMPITVVIWHCIGLLIIPVSWYIGYMQIKELEV